MAANEEAGPAFTSLAAYRVDRGGRGNAVADTTRALREAILDGVIAPNEWLREETLTRELGVSRTPVREALSRLEEEGLIERTPGQGACVTALTIEDMSVVYQVRGSLESLTAQMAAERGTVTHKAELHAVHDAMRAAAERLDPAEFSRLNIEFHASITSMADNAYLTRLLTTVETAIRRFGTCSYSMERMTEIVHEHEAISAAIASGDGQAAAQAAVEHAAHARTATLSWFFDHI